MAELVVVEKTPVERAFHTIVLHWLDPVLANRTLNIFLKYGVSLQSILFDVLLHAKDQGKMPQVLDLLDEYYQRSRLWEKEDWCRGTSVDIDGRNPTREMFQHLCWNVLEFRLSSWWVI